MPVPVVTSGMVDSIQPVSARIPLEPGPVLPLGEGAWTVALPGYAEFLHAEGTWKTVPPRRAVVGDALARWFERLRVTTYAHVEGRRTGDDIHLDVLRLDVTHATSRSPAPDLARDLGSTGLDDLLGFAEVARGRFEDALWPAFHAEVGEPGPPPGTAASTGMCRVSTACLAAALREAFPEGGWRAAGGSPLELRGVRLRGLFVQDRKGVDGGMWDRDRESWDGHYWVTGRHGGRDVLVDVTADQYGWGAVTVTPAADPRYHANYKANVALRDVSLPVFLRLAREFAPAVVDEWQAAIGNAPGR